MDTIIEIAILAGAFLVPPVLLILSKRKVLVLIMVVLWFWGMMVLSCEYQLATNPDYDSIAPGISVLFGWFFGLFYCVPWFAIALVIKSYKQKPPKSMAKVTGSTDSQLPN